MSGTLRSGEPGEGRWGWMTAVSRVIDEAVFPRSCLVCGASSTEPGACEACLAAMVGDPALVCRRCGLPWLKAVESALRATSIGACPRCAGRSQGYEGVVALGPYRDALRALCLALKKPYHAWLAPTLAAAALASHLGWIEAWLECGDADGPALVAGVPLHWRRRWSRGYNQADALASAVARGLGLQRGSPLRRARATPHLAPLGAVRRNAALRRAFEMRRGGVDLVRGRDVVLVDDIMTSGATCGAAARRLRQSGARRVLVVVIARAEVAGR